MNVPQKRPMFAMPRGVTEELTDCSKPIAAIDSLAGSESKTA